MAPPPPPPGAPPPPAPGPVLLTKAKAGKGDRKDLLKDIQKGKRLKPTETNDRSAPLVGKPAAGSPGPTSSASRSGDGASSQPSGPLPGIGGLFAGGLPTLKKTKGGVSTGRTTDSNVSSNLVSAKSNIGIGNSNKNSHNSSSSSLNSSPSLSPSPSHVGSTPTHIKTPVSAKHSVMPLPPTNKPNVPSSKPMLSPRPHVNSPGPVHPSAKPPPPPPNGKLAATSLSRNPISKSFNQTIGHGPQGRPQIPKYGSNISKDDTSIRNGEIGQAPPPPVRTVSQPQITQNRVPSRAPPPPPPSHKRPSQPPPPPPTHPPPPPGILPPNKALPPPPISYITGDPPTPPTRRESIYRTGPASSGYNSSTSSTGENFESRFSSRFRAIQFLPPPEPFSGCQKTYPSKNTLPVRQGSQIKRTPAPPPPPCKNAPPTAPPPPPCKTEVGVSGPGKPPLPPVRQWSTTASGML